MTDLVSLAVRDFSAALASDAPAPGGGSASAAAGAMGAALLGMVCRLTIGKEKYRDAWEELERIASAIVRPCALSTSTCRSFATISSGL